MLNIPLKNKIPIIRAKLQSLLDVRQHPLWQTLTFGLIFGVIGGLIIWHSLAVAIPPTTPASLQANPVSSSEIDLSWAPSISTGVVGYNIYQVELPVPDNDNVPPDTDELVGQASGPNTNTFKLTGLESDTVYNFYVEAKDTEGNLSAPSNQVSETTLNDSVTSGGFAAQNTSGSAWPYKNPFGDKSCMKQVNGTPALVLGCICQTSGGVTCDGSCVDSAYAASIGVDISTYVCRPGGVYELNYPSYQTNFSDIYANVQDEGVDYNALGYPYPQHGRTPAYVYAVGRGTIINVTTGMKPAFPGNSSFGPNWIAYRLQHNGPGGGKGPADGLEVYVSEYCTLASNATNDVTATDGTGNNKGDMHLGHRWKVGDSVTANSILCTMDAAQKPVNGYADISGKLYSRGIETGWSNNALVQAKAYYCYGGHGHIPTQFGFSFSQFVHQSGGPKGLPDGFAGGHKYRYTYPGTHLHYYPCPPFPSEYKGSWY